MEIDWWILRSFRKSLSEERTCDDYVVSIISSPIKDDVIYMPRMYLKHSSKPHFLYPMNALTTQVNNNR